MCLFPFIMMNAIDPYRLDITVRLESWLLQLAALGELWDRTGAAAGQAPLVRAFERSINPNRP